MYSGPIQIFAQDVFVESATPTHPVGTKAITSDGRTWRYAKNASTALTTGVLCVQADLSANHEDVPFQTAGVIGDTSIALTIATTSVAANEYVDGYAVVIDDTGEGRAHLITAHGTGTGTVTFYIKPGLLLATTTSTTVCLVRNPWMDVVINDSTQTDLPAGVTPMAITADYYFWIQTGGVTAVLASGTNTPTAGSPVTIGEATNGAVSGRDAVAEPLVGQALTSVAPTSGEYGPVFLTIDR